MLTLPYKIYRALKNSCKGLKVAFKSEWAFQLEFILLIISIPIALYISPHLIERILMISSMLIILVTELMNTAVEVTVDRISLDHHELSGRAKDLASAATLFAIINAMVIWGMIIF
jgi:diacylglycerol kinase (ATP)